MWTTNHWSFLRSIPILYWKQQQKAKFSHSLDHPRLPFPGCAFPRRWQKGQFRENGSSCASGMRSIIGGWARCPVKKHISFAGDHDPISWNRFELKNKSTVWNVRAWTPGRKLRILLSAAASQPIVSTLWSWHLSVPRYSRRKLVPQ